LRQKLKERIIVQAEAVDARHAGIELSLWGSRFYPQVIEREDFARQFPLS
jgi:hypothetical protein